MERSSSTDRFQPLTSTKSKDGIEITPDVYGFTTQIVNVYMIGNPAKSKDWILVDAGMPLRANTILEKAAERFGDDHRLKAILLTHGHFDHIGGLIDILEKHPVPVYAHPEELPYITGQKDYPQADPTVEGGMLAKLSIEFPVKGIDISEHANPLPADGAVPGLPEWNWYHTPGHSDGHISFFRERDRFLIVGDAFLTVKQDSLFDVLFQRKKVSGPPVYLTTDWTAAKNSVQQLRALEPSIAAPGHGKPVIGSDLAEGLTKLSARFDEVARPDHGKYIKGK
ncbi:MBL fold metallo-hydrolase [Planococcus lenghuensis]|uniref:MBL fold metallo-hydrolase n=1 Tax=Planococcus lenghuensis TaxID=2213202 RepID=A0A1Q2L4H0_9BACL|nr:MBL fold metallo-hydrolase [Planococcus lenghuensis]AQQ54967.1 MBL fold metallo-hydrolase [Planococcus lenghuensis]